MRIPIIRLDRVYHVGTLDPADVGRGAGPGSFEGLCLSISPCPAAWTAIARLGGIPWHAMTNAGGRFLDMHEAVSDPSLCGEILDWARDTGLVVDRTAWKAWSFDEELDNWVFGWFGTENEAYDDLDLMNPDLNGETPRGPDGDPAVVEALIPCATEALLAMTRLTLEEFEDATDAAVLAWIIAADPTVDGGPIDGLWWNELLNEDGLSAPRGGILPDRLGSWASKAIPAYSVDEDMTVAETPAAEWVDIELRPMIDGSRPPCRDLPRPL